jgi:single-strand DNA-binding protein
MSSYNHVTLMGRLGGDPDLRYSPDGTAFATLSVATSENYKDKQGNKQERTDWNRVKLSGRVAEIAGEYLKKGDLALFEGKLRTDKYQTKDGKDAYDTHVRCFGMQLIGGKRDGQKAERPQEQQAAADDFDDSIPF